MKKALLTVISMFLIFVMCLFAVNAEGEKMPKSASIINDGESVNVYLSEDEWKHSIKFIPTETDCYEFFAESLEIDSIDITLRDHLGECIAISDFNEYVNECSITGNLKANNTYYLEICYWGSSADLIDVSIKSDRHKHIYSETNEYISKASTYYDGYIENTCVKCEERVETIIPKVILTLSNDEFIYNGNTQVPTLTVTDSASKIFVEGTDYSVLYPKTSVDVDYYYITVTMDNEYYDVLDEVYYTIKEKTIEDCIVKLSKNKIYYGEKPTITISGLKEDKDFECDILYWGVGEQVVTVYGIGNYTGEKKVNFTVYPANVTGLKVSKTTSSSITLSWKEDKDYSTQYYQIYDVKKKKIVATIDAYDTTYTIKKLKAGTVYNFKVRSYTKENGEKYYGEWQTITGVTSPTTVTLSSLKSAKVKTVTVKWNKQTTVTGYQIQYSTSSNFSNAKTVKVTKNSTTSKTLTGLKSGKKYYVKIRTYKTLKVNGKSKTVYSLWSKATSVKVK